MIYLDYAATSPMSKPAIDAYVEVANSYFGNTASLHDEGGKAQALIQEARKIIARKLGVNEDGILFTGSGTEGNILAILSLARASNKGKHIITSIAEHTSVHAAMNTLELEGYEITRLNFTEKGIIDLEQLKANIRTDTALISIQHVNSEIGSIQPVEQIAHIAKENNIRYHVDCVQSFCKLSILSFAKLVDGITISAHKIGGPKGCGAIYLNPSLLVKPLFPGVTHERGLRGGTLDTPAIAAMAMAVEKFEYSIHDQNQLRHQFKEALNADICIWVEADLPHQLPSICGLYIKGVEGQLILLKLNESGIYISTGSACDINSASGTKAILAMNYSLNDARSFFRVSFGSTTTTEEIEQVADRLNKIMAEENMRKAPFT